MDIHVVDPRWVADWLTNPATVEGILAILAAASICLMGILIATFFFHDP